MLSEPDILNALRDCFDPEVKLNVVDLGLIYSIALEPDPDSTPRWPRQRVKVTMTLTSAECPANDAVSNAINDKVSNANHDAMLEQVQNRLATIPEIGKVELELVWEPKWTPHRISAAGRKQLGL